MFSITFTKSQAEKFIHGIFQNNFRDNPEFIVRISDEVIQQKPSMTPLVFFGSNAEPVKVEVKLD